MYILHMLSDSKTIQHNVENIDQMINDQTVSSGFSLPFLKLQITALILDQENMKFID